MNIPRSLAIFLALAPAAFGATCDSLSSLNLPGTTITKVALVPEGSFEAPGLPPPQQAAFKRLPEFCRVAATLKPTSDSEIKIEVWLPTANWNGRFLGVGNGGWSGAIVYGALANGVGRGYAVASTNTGHDGADATFVTGHPEKLVDFGYRAVHEMTVKGKALTEAFYTKAPERSYWNGCSSGGKQGLKEAQKFPRDYDGIIAGAPANYWTHLMAGDLWPEIVTHKDPAADLSPASLAVLHKAALAACDANDGVTDGLIEEPVKCRFDPATVACKGDQTQDCLTAPQVEAARRIYAGAVNPRTHKSVFPGMPPGSELVWPALAGPKPFTIPVSHFAYVVFKNPQWDYLTFDYDKDVAAADKIDDGLLNATDPNLKAFFSHGGKLITYHGWNDQLISPINSVNYYETVVKANGGAAKVSESYRLFMAPGMNHCGGGDGPSQMDPLPLLDDWVANGKAPDKIIAQHRTGNRVDRSRPWCSYPQIAKYKGTGSTDEAANFDCVTPR